MGSLHGKVALVLGAARVGNMGQAIAQRLTAEGAQVMAAGRDRDALRQLAETSGCAVAACDITRQDDLAELTDRTIETFGKIDIAVNATGFNQVKPFLDVTLEELHAITQVQFTGTFLFMQAVLRCVADGGSIIQISSVSAKGLLPNHAAYMATKSAGDVLVRALADEFGVRGIRVNSIAPGPTADTPMAASVLTQTAIRDRIVAATPLRRLGTAADIAEAVVWLAGDCNFMTGEVLQVNGGRAINRLY